MLLNHRHFLHLWNLPPTRQKSLVLLQLQYQVVLILNLLQLEANLFIPQLPWFLQLLLVLLPCSLHLQRLLQAQAC